MCVRGGLSVPGATDLVGVWVAAGRPVQGTDLKVAVEAFSVGGGAGMPLSRVCVYKVTF